MLGDKEQEEESAYDFIAVRVRESCPNVRGTSSQSRKSKSISGPR
jgi:hypothetical protein